MHTGHGDPAPADHRAPVLLESASDVWDHVVEEHEPAAELPGGN
jgi:hypothetical protein